jgi:hypothetical protein
MRRYLGRLTTALIAAFALAGCAGGNDGDSQGKSGASQSMLAFPFSVQR